MTVEPPRARGQYLATLLANQPVCRDHFRLVLGAPYLPPTAPGQFIQLQCRRLDPQTSAREVAWQSGSPPTLTQPELTNREPFLRRPLSLAGRRQTPQGAELDVIYRVIGAGTGWLSRAQPGEQLSLIGPLGNAFRIGPAPRAAIVGGGVGIPPMMYLAEALAAAGKEVVAFSGARARDLLPLELTCQDPSPAGHPLMCVREFADLGIPSVVATDDASAGFAGVVSEALRNWLSAHLPEPAELAVYCCGPEPLMRAVSEIALSRGYACQLALERHMACGLGTCQSCVVKIRDQSPRGWAFKLCCTDGPVFDAQDVLW
jgi:dihydroorotate dehydrogenase electron transfer subunit